MRRMLLLVCAALVVVSPALGAGTARFYAPNLAAALRKQVASMDNGGFYFGSKCQALGGNAKVGWLHITCVGKYSLEGDLHPYKAVFTPKGCKSKTLDLKITGAYDNGSTYESISTQVWTHDVFACKVT